MFLSGVLGGSVFKTIDPDEERLPPPDPTPITFPTYEERDARDWSDAALLPDFQRLFAEILKPADVGESHSAALNVSHVRDCSLEDLVPAALRHRSTEKLRENKDGPQSFTTDESEDAANRQKDFEDRIAELGIDNDTAFRTLTRTLPAGVKGPRLAWTRKFWSGLESMSPYWDCSLDRYYDISERYKTDDASSKRQRVDSDGRQRPSPSPGPDTASSFAISDYTEATGSSNPNLRYKGRRTGCGADMPEAFRSETARALVEAAVFPFQCSVLPPRQMPVIQFDKLNLPIRQTAAVYRVPKDRAKARQGRTEGPLIVVQVRSDIDFTDSTEGSMLSKSRLDLLRELGGLLQLAQERRREHLTEVKPGDGKWWTSVPRWGGGPGNHEADTADIVQLAEESLDAAQGRTTATSKARKRRTPIAIWKELKVGSGQWDARTDYMAIGQDVNSPYDDIFMVSSLNHHVSILKLRVHGAYTDSLRTGQYPTTIPHENDWSRPTLSRSRWYDLFSREERIEAFQGIWNIMTYLTRPTEPTETETPRT